MSTTSVSPVGPRSSWFADRSLAVKFGILVAVVVLACGGMLAAMLAGNASVREANLALERLTEAEKLVLQLDARAGELTVDGFQAFVREDPVARLEKLAVDLATPEALLTELRTVELSGRSAQAVTVLGEGYATYTDAVRKFVDVAIRDPDAARLRWGEFQAANDLTVGEVSAAQHALARERAFAQAKLDEAISRSHTVGLGVTAVALALIAAASTVTIRSVTRSVGRVTASLDALATEDLTVPTGIHAEDEVGQMAAALDAAQDGRRQGTAGAVASAHAVTASSGSVATVAAGAQQMGDSPAEIGDVVKVLTSIAEQTKLLALNVTVGAARAGEAGKGFAVVAHEVRDLAQETAKATEHIARRVQAIRGDTAAAVTAIEEISRIVGRISDRQVIIASAVEEHTATTHEDELSRTAVDQRSVGRFTY